MLEDLKNKKLIYEEEIDRENEIITIKKKDGTVVKEIPYGETNVKINISKTPEKEKTASALLEVTSVEGLGEHLITNEELNQKISKMTEKEKRETIKYLYVICTNTIYGDANIINFNDLLIYLYNIDNEYLKIESPTEESFWEMISRHGIDIEDNLGEEIVELMNVLCKDEKTNKIKVYEIINPEMKVSNDYIAIKNGTYTFTVKNLLAGNEYKKSVQVTNIDESVPYYFQNYLYIYGGRKSVIRLIDRETGEPVEFEEIYVIYNGNRINVTEWCFAYAINNELNGIETSEISRFLVDELKILTIEEADDKLLGQKLEFILIKDGIEYIGKAVMNVWAI